MDQCHGSSLLRQPSIRRIVTDALLFFENERSTLHGFVLMPNHVHLAARALGDWQIEDVLKSWKGFTSREINKLTGQKGQLWQEDNWNRVIQRRRFTRQSPEIIAGALKLDLLHHEATLADAALKLTPTEFALLKVLAEHAARIVTQNQIMKQVWAGQSSDLSEGLRVHINHLRKKLGESGPRIVNEPGIGYRLEA